MKRKRQSARRPAKRVRDPESSWSLRSPEARLQDRERLRAKYAEAKRMLRDLITRLGARCFICEEDGTREPLTVDHIDGRGWEKPAREYRYDIRVKRYYEEYVRGVRLRVLCHSCNSSYRPPTQEERDAATTCPF